MVPVRKIPTRREGNRLFPLPEDYHSLTEEGQSMARANAVAQWAVPWATEREKADAFEAAVDFFDLWYLWPDAEEEFDPRFYDHMPVPAPSWHRGMWRDWATCKASLHVAPRGSAKSNVVRKTVVPQMLTARTKFTYASSTHANASDTGQRLKDQFLWNPRIHHDFRRYFPDGRIVPKKGHAAFSTEWLYIGNGSSCRMVSAEGRQRGGRPHVYVLDDPEYDPKASTSMETLREGARELIFKIAMPMVTQPGTSIRWLATFISRRHYAWHAMETEETPLGPRAVIPEFNLWHRMLIRAEFERTAEDGSVTSASCWPEMWPLTEEDAVELAKRTGQPKRNSLEYVRELVGPAIYLSEYMGRPGEGDAAYFPTLVRERHGWWLEDADAEFELEPRVSDALMCYVGKDGAAVREGMREFLRKCWVFVTVDTSYTERRDSDFKVATVMALTPENELFVLDLWGGQVPEDRLVKETFRLSDKWRAGSIHPEVVRESINLFHALDSAVRQRAHEITGAHLCKVVPLKVGVADKCSRISTLRPRFDHGIIKLPLWRRSEAHWSKLFDQLEQFNPEARDGGLANDDHVDTVSMSTAILKGRPHRQADPEAAQEAPLERMLRGELTDRDGTPLLQMLDFSTLTVENITDIADKSNAPARVSRV